MENQINFLIDTNIWLELLLNQDQAETVKEFLNTIPSENLYLSDFSLHSIGVILDRLEKIELFNNFITDLFLTGNVSILGIEPLDNIEVSKLITDKNFDYDDAYQIAVSQKYNIEIVTFDKDFMNSGIKTLNPNEALEKYKTLNK